MWLVFWWLGWKPQWSCGLCPTQSWGSTCRSWDQNSGPHNWAASTLSHWAVPPAPLFLFDKESLSAVLSPLGATLAPQVLGGIFIFSLQHTLKFFPRPLLWLRGCWEMCFLVYKCFLIFFHLCLISLWPENTFLSRFFFFFFFFNTWSLLMVQDVACLGMLL